jgi:hypothetical protein
MYLDLPKRPTFWNRGSTKHLLKRNVKQNGTKNTNLISKSLPNLSCCKGKLLAIVVVQVLEVYKNALGSLWSHIPMFPHKIDPF